MEEVPQNRQRLNSVGETDIESNFGDSNTDIVSETSGTESDFGDSDAETETMDSDSGSDSEASGAMEELNINEEWQQNGTTYTYLRLAIEMKDVAEVRQLIQDGADVNQLTQIDSEDSFTPLLIAVNLDDCPAKFQILQILLDYGADINLPDHDGITPLQVAPVLGSYAIVELLATGAINAEEVQDSELQAQIIGHLNHQVD
jgi:ankyrin repeat protein